MRPRSLLKWLFRVWAPACVLFLTDPAGLLAAPPLGAARQPRWSRFTDVIFRHFTSDTGLPFTGATAIAQDREGFLWIGSQSGLARWDGQRFRLYRAADLRSGLRDDLIKALHVDAAGRLWVGTNAGGIAHYDARADRFVAYGAGPQSLSHAGIRAIEDDGHGGLWVATSGGLDRIDPTAGTIRRYRHSARDDTSLPDDHVGALSRAPGGRLWVGTRAGLSLFDPGRGTFLRTALPGRPGAGQPAVTALAQDHRGGLWIGTAGAGAFRRDPTTMVIDPVRESGDRRSTLERQTVNAIAEAGDDVWIATAGSGIAISDASAEAKRRVVHNASVASSLSDDAPVSLFRDRSGALWVGTQRGLSRYDPTRTGVWTLLGGTKQPGAPSNQDVTAVLAASDGRVWLGLGSNGVEILDPSSGTTSPLARGATTVLPPVAISAFAELAGGRVAIGTNAGLFESDREGRSLRSFGFSGRERTREVTALLREGSTLWIGRFDGLWRLTVANGQASRPVRMMESDRLADRRVMSIARGSDDALWIGTQNGLHRVVPGSGVADRVELSATGADGLVPTILADKRGRIWAGVYGHGLALIERPDRRPWRIRRIDVAQGLPDANVNMLMADSAGRVWASTDGGLAVIDPERLGVRALRRADAVAITAYWTGSGTPAPGGQLLFGGLGGLTIIDPRHVAAPRPSAGLAVTEIRIGGRRVPVAGVGDPGTPAALTVHPEANSVSVEFAALDYAEAADGRYAYRLRGYEDAWTGADADHRSASYTNLPPGDYVLEIRSVVRGVRRDEPTLDVSIHILPAWYQTLWSKLAFGVAALGAIWAVVLVRTAVLRRRQHILERLVADRTAVLRTTQRELEQMAYIDVLTGLPNRRMFNDELRACLERADRRGDRAALLLIDLDHFKEVNDTHGHDAGDALLAEVAHRLQGVVGEFDILARLGGDEFAIVAPDVLDLARVEELCRRITRSVAEPILFGGARLPASASVGIALYRSHAATASELYKAADVALYAAKKRHRGSWSFYGDDGDEGRPPEIVETVGKRRRQLGSLPGSAPSREM